MDYEFKKLSDVDVVAEPTESANVLIEENGVIKKAPKTAVGGGGEPDAIITATIGTDNAIVYTLTSGTFNELKEKILNKEPLNTIIMVGEIFAYDDTYTVNVKIPSCMYYQTNDVVILEFALFESINMLMIDSNNNVFTA